MQDKTAPAAATTASRCADEVRIAQVSLELISWTRMHNAQSYVGTMGSGWGDGVGWRRHTVMFERERIFHKHPAGICSVPTARPTGHTQIGDQRPETTAYPWLSWDICLLT